MQNDDLGRRAAELQKIADRLHVPWRDRAKDVPPDDPVAMIGLMADVLGVDFYLALDPAAEVPLKIAD